MRERIGDYIKSVERALNNKKTDLHLLRDDLLVHIEFYQHERLVHFLVTFLVAVIAVILLVVNVVLSNILFLLLFIIFVILLIPYMFHYYFLENKVQYMYKLYDDIKYRLKK